MKWNRRKGALKPEEDVNEFIKTRCPGFEYAGNYTGADGRADIRCLQCGSITNRSMIAIRHNHVRCRVCEKKRITEREETKRREKERREKEREEKKKRIAEEAEQKRLAKIHPCPVCGTITSRPKYCSVRCRRKANDAQKNIRRRKKLDSVLVDKDITVKGLFKRDKGICYLCGRECSFDDYTIRDGVFLAGNYYPSIDHVIPLIKGGVHSWDNVRLAHRICNILKRDK